MNRPGLLDQARAVARMRYLSLRTEEAYCDWIRRFILFHQKRHPSEMGADQIRQFLTHLAVKSNVAASTQNQALCALLFLYRDVLRVELPYVEGIERARPTARTRARRLHQTGGVEIARATVGHVRLNRWPPLRSGPATNGGTTLASQRCGFRLSANYRALRQRREGSTHHSPTAIDRAFTVPVGSHQAGTRARFARRLR